MTITPENVDREVLASVFAARCAIARKPREAAMKEAGEEWDRTVRWIDSKARGQGSFLDWCDEFDLDAGAVRKAIAKARGT